MDKKAGSLQDSTLGVAVHQGDDAHRLRGRYDDALTDLNHAIALNPRDARAAARRGETYRLMGRYDDALADLNHAIELEPFDNAGAAANRGATYVLMGRYDDALADLNHAIALNPDDAEAAALRGETYRLMGRYDDALADLNHAIALNPDDAWAATRRGVTYLLMGRDEEALADLNHAIALNPDDAWATALRGETYRLMGRYDDALADLIRAMALNPDDAWATGRLSETYRAMSQYDDALAEFPVTIYLADESIHEQVEAAVEDWLSTADLIVEERDEPIIGSWFRGLRAGAKQAMHSPSGQDALLTAAHAVDLRMVLAQDAAVTATLLQGVAPVIASLQPTKDAVVRAGAVLIVKIDYGVRVFQLTAAQQVILDHQPQLLAAPEAIIAALQISTPNGEGTLPAGPPH